MATDVPTAWAAVPIESPWAMGLLTRDSFIILKPVMPPNMPVHTTTAAVSAGMPPMVPLYRQLESIKKQFMPILLAEVAGCIVGIASVVIVAQILGASREVVMSLASKSVTT